MISLIALAVTCASPVDYGGFPNDGLDDGPALRAAFADPAVQSVCLDYGVYNIGYNRFAGVTVPQGKSLSGMGPSTVLAQTGSMHGSTSYAVLLLGGSLSNLMMIQDITEPDNAGQNHLVQVGDGDGADISGVQLYSSSQGGGDCIRLVGGNNAQTRTHITNVVGMCNRSGIAVQHGVVSASVTASVFSARTDQALDYEPTSAGPTRILWSGNVFLCASVTHTECVTLSNAPGENGSVFAGNMVLGGNIQAVRADGVAFLGNTVIGDATAPSTTFEVIRNATGTRVQGNLIIRPPGAPAGGLIAFKQNAGYAPEHVMIQDNYLVQSTSGPAVYLEGAKAAIVSGNSIRLIATYAGAAIQCSSILRACSLNVIAQNVMEADSYKFAVVLSGWTAGNIATGSNIVLGNIGSGFQFGVGCSGPFQGPVVIDDNVLGPNVCPQASSGTNF